MLVIVGKMETSSEPASLPRETPRRVPWGGLRALAPNRAREINSPRATGVSEGDNFHHSINMGLYI